MPIRGRLVAVLAFTMVALLGVTSSRALDYPTKPVRLIVGFAAGGPADTVARLMAQYLQTKLGQPVVVENRVGGSANLAAGYVVNAEPDGHTVLLIGTNNAINTSLFKDLPFDFMRDIIPVAGLTRFSYVMAVASSIPPKTVAEFIAYAKASPNKITFASGGTGTSNHLAGELFRVMTGIDMVHIPYRGNAAAYPDVMTGRVQMIFADVGSSSGHIRSGTLRAIGVSAAKPMEQMPGVPTIAETVPGYEASAFYGLGVPKGTSPEIITKLNATANEGLKDASLVAKFKELGVEPIPFTPADFGAFMVAEEKRWRQAVEASGAKPE
jgi:tripartite-type tricarboxylate transporter receptor subunit TctC